MFHLNDNEIKRLKQIFKKEESGRGIVDLLNWLDRKKLLNRDKIRKLLKKVRKLNESKFL